MFKFFGALLTLALAVGLLIVTWPQLFGLQTTHIIAQITAMRGLLVACCAVGMIVFLLIGIVRPLRAFAGGMAVVLLLAGLGNAGILFFRGTGQEALPAAGEGAVTVLSWNTLGSAPGVAAIARLAIESGADVVALPETRQEDGVAIAVAMREAGRPMWVHTEAVGQIAAAHSTTVLISPRLGRYEQVTSNAEGTDNTRVVPSIVMAPSDGVGPTIIASHAVSPSGAQMDNWREDLDWLAKQCEGDNVIIAGDFNATLDSMAGLGTGGGATLGRCHDAAKETGNAALGTWPTDIPALLGSPIDHVFASPGWKITGMQVHTEFDRAGSDHRPITVRLEPRG
ncbi:endonuclease/exonuclease/phosphatase family protein [Mycetocola spongiae]|uniref:endonuclease/exonuclease/phosphatase family protein n=1 Tax=Mycetocola spongiae TaxID=2859226 RepID=UPI001CF3BCC6|nr:endonuclease/exonuclease/phosphatase family protein [Mycetocola spongiae]UCR89061.1 endonuclease/exonuclease/phosphatase family protein [Mycetocola spongiae]